MYRNNHSHSQDGSGFGRDKFAILKKGAENFWIIIMKNMLIIHDVYRFATLNYFILLFSILPTCYSFSFDISLSMIYFGNIEWFLYGMFCVLCFFLGGAVPRLKLINSITYCFHYIFNVSKYLRSVAARRMNMVYFSILGGSTSTTTRYTQPFIYLFMILYLLYDSSTYILAGTCCHHQVNNCPIKSHYHHFSLVPHKYISQTFPKHYRALDSVDSLS